MAAAWTEAPEVRAIANELIPEYHAHLNELAGEIRYVFRESAQKSKGREVWGKAHKITGMAAYLAEAVDGEQTPFIAPEFFLMEIAYDVWKDLTLKGKRALVDHELMHFTIDIDENSGALVLAIKGHDIEEFHEIIVRHGLWKDDLEIFNKAIQQHLDGMGPESGHLKNTSISEGRG